MTLMSNLLHYTLEYLKSAALFVFMILLMIVGIAISAAILYGSIRILWILMNGVNGCVKL